MARLWAYKKRGKVISYSALARQMKTSQANVWRWLNGTDPRGKHYELINSFLEKAS